jgi:hypothetical protein
VALEVVGLVVSVEVPEVEALTETEVVPVQLDKATMGDQAKVLDMAAAAVVLARQEY